MSMSSTRFARSGRVRICILMTMFIVLLMMIVIYHLSQQQLDESRAFQEGLSVKMQSLTAEKLTAEKRANLLRSEKMGLQEKYDNQLSEAMQKQQETQEKYEGQVEKFKLLTIKHDELEAEFVKSKKQHIEDTNAFEQKLQTLLSELHKDKTAKEQVVAQWKEKHDKLRLESEHKLHALEVSLKEYKANCHFIPKVQPAEAPHQQQLNKPGEHLATTTRTHANPGQLPHSIEKPQNEKSKTFNEQVQVSDGLYKFLSVDGGLGVKLLATNPTIRTATITTTTTNLPKEQLMPLMRQNNSLILNSVENFQIIPKPQQPQPQQEEPQLASAGNISPLGPPHKISTSASSVGAAKQQDAGPNASVAPKPSISSSGLPPLALPPAKPAERKLPENVAPIPDNFENKGEDTAAEELPKNEANNRYANVVNDLETKPKPNEDSGAHEVKDALNEPNFNLPAAVGGAEQHFFDGDLPAPRPGGQGEAGPEEGPKPNGEQALAGGPGAGGGGVGEDDDDMNDVAVKQPQHLLDENLNNEIAADQGKEFPEGLHIDDGMEEDQDEDDYSNAALRKQGAEAIRH
ncbi:uncharacterized protein Dwil_GK13766, isoform B [Drosophila willistoni]|uniref:Uncharacterized protein, isoform B n=1 Tax=Drosophila willistoni TaxID=7260 RepID=A0A0Q9WWP7_DROWI|nr:uncharacterized protein LOC6651250 isoform X1 [Drosophila willistoni]KRF99864.1 uncharacterized protein Dwil_GK13766, isoform B [Drosophila willistoni]